MAYNGGDVWRVIVGVLGIYSGKVEAEIRDVPRSVQGSAFRLGAVIINHNLSFQVPALTRHYYVFYACHSAWKCAPDY